MQSLRRLYPQERRSRRQPQALAAAVFFYVVFSSGVIGPTNLVKGQHQAADFRPQGLVLLAAQLGTKGLRRLAELLAKGA